MQGVFFNDKYSNDYDAIMNYARITPAAIKEKYVDIAGGDSDIDLTEAVGGVAFEDGKIDFKFTFFDRQRKEQMKNDLHGRTVRIVLERDPNFYFEGRIKCTQDNQDKSLYELCFVAKVKPYKYERRETVQVEKVSGRQKELILSNSRMPVMPRIAVTGKVSLTYEGTRYNMQTGIYQAPEITLYEGHNYIKLTGEGTVKFEYRKGMLI
jgi:hypothetical protein